MRKIKFYQRSFGYGYKRLLRSIVRVSLDKMYYLVPMHGWFELYEKWNDPIATLAKAKDIPKIDEIIGYVSGGSENSLHINPFGENTLQLTESEVMGTGIRMGDTQNKNCHKNS